MKCSTKVSRVYNRLAGRFELCDQSKCLTPRPSWYALYHCQPRTLRLRRGTTTATCLVKGKPCPATLPTRGNTLSPAIHLWDDGMCKHGIVSLSNPPSLSSRSSSHQDHFEKLERRDIRPSLLGLLHVKKISLDGRESRLHYSLGRHDPRVVFQTQTFSNPLHQPQCILGLTKTWWE